MISAYLQELIDHWEAYLKACESLLPRRDVFSRRRDRHYRDVIVMPSEVSLSALDHVSDDH